MSKKLFLLLFCIGTPYVSLYGASSSQAEPHYLDLDPIRFEGWGQIEVKKLDPSQLSEEGFAFLKTNFPDLSCTLEKFKKELIDDKTAFFFKSSLPTEDGREKYLTLAICTSLIIENEQRLTRILWMAVDQDLRRRGIGRAMVDHITKNTNADVISLDPINLATKFYIALGFETPKTKEEAIRYRNPWVKIIKKNETLLP